MQNTDKCKMSPISARREFKFHKITISVCCSLAAPCLIFHLQRFISSFSPRWPCKSQINFHFECLTSDCCRKTPSSVPGNTMDPNLTGSRSEKNTGCNLSKTTLGPSGRGHYWTEIISSSKQCVTLHDEFWRSTGPLNRNNMPTAHDWARIKENTSTFQNGANLKHIVSVILRIFKQLSLKTAIPPLCAHHRCCCIRRPACLQQWVCRASLRENQWGRCQSLLCSHIWLTILLSSPTSP